MQRSSGLWAVRRVTCSVAKAPGPMVVCQRYAEETGGTSGRTWTYHVAAQQTGYFLDGAWADIAVVLGSLAGCCTQFSRCSFHCRDCKSQQCIAQHRYGTAACTVPCGPQNRILPHLHTGSMRSAQGKCTGVASSRTVEAETHHRVDHVHLAHVRKVRSTA
jgi:hypothetical protein